MTRKDFIKGLAGLIGTSLIVEKLPVARGRNPVQKAIPQKGKYNKKYPILAIFTLLEIRLDGTFNEIKKFTAPCNIEINFKLDDYIGQNRTEVVNYIRISMAPDTFPKNGRYLKVQWNEGKSIYSMYVIISNCGFSPETGDFCFICLPVWDPFFII